MGWLAFCGGQIRRAIKKKTSNRLEEELDKDHIHLSSAVAPYEIN